MLTLERLEDRLVPAMSFNPSTGLLLFDGGAFKDSAALVEGTKPGTVCAVMDSYAADGSHTHQFLVLNKADITSVLFDGKAGNDQFQNHTSLATVAFGGAGDDVLYASNRIGEGSNHFFGGDGNDYLHGGSNADTLDGGAGTDTAKSVGTNDTVLNCEVF